MSKKWHNQAAKMKSLPPNWGEGQYKGVKPIEVQVVKHDEIFRKGPIRFVSKEEYEELMGKKEGNFDRLYTRKQLCGEEE